MLGRLISRLHHPDVAAEVLATLDPELAARIERRAAEASMSVADFAAAAVRAFVDGADDDSWFQLLTVVRTADDPGLAALQTILKLAVAEPQPPT